MKVITRPNGVFIIVNDGDFGILVRAAISTQNDMEIVTIEDLNEAVFLLDKSLRQN